MARDLTDIISELTGEGDPSKEPADESADELEGADDEGDATTEGEPDEESSAEGETEDSEPDSGDTEAESAPDDESDEGEQGEPAPEPAPAPSLQPDVRAEVEELRRQNAYLAGLLERQQQPTPPAPSPENDLPDNVLRAVMFGASEEALRAIPVSQRELAQKVAERHAARQVQLARNPGLLAQEMSRQVMPQIVQFLQPVLDAHRVQQVDRLVTTHLDPIKDKTVKERAVQLFKAAPGVDRANWDQRDQIMSMAVKAAQGEAAQARREANGQSTKAGKAQAKAAKGKTLKATPKTGGSGSGRKALPDYKPGETPSQYARRIAPLFEE
jgi:hypothetical protein